MGKKTHKTLIYSIYTHVHIHVSKLSVFSLSCVGKKIFRGIIRKGFHPEGESRNHFIAIFGFLTEFLLLCP